MHLQAPVFGLYVLSKGQWQVHVLERVHSKRLKIHQDCDHYVQGGLYVTQTWFLSITLKSFYTKNKDLHSAFQAPYCSHLISHGIEQRACPVLGVCIKCNVASHVRDRRERERKKKGKLEALLPHSLGSNTNCFNSGHTSLWKFTSLKKDSGVWAVDCVTIHEQYRCLFPYMQKEWKHSC